MNTQDQIKALAELDGWKYQDDHAMWVSPTGQPGFALLPDYLTSYDAIIPLIQKQPPEIRAEMFERTNGRVTIMSTPMQLCELLLQATGKWTTE